jgi:lipoprotein-releasing system permease protein
VLLCSFSILFGFKENIREKIFSFSGHLLISKYDNNNAVEYQPINKYTSLDTSNLDKANISHIHVFANKAALLKTNKDNAGIVLKGIDQDFNENYFKNNIIKGSLPAINPDSVSKEVLISNYLAKLLKLKVGDSFILFFIQNPPKFRKMTISGIYETQMEEFDQVFVLGDLKMVQQVNNWGDSLVGGYEIFVKDLDKIDDCTATLFDNMAMNMQIEKISDKYMQIFDWFGLLDRNVLILVVMIAIVASFNVVTSLFILIMEKTAFIGLMKAMGSNNELIRSIFVSYGRKILLQGLLIGNAIGIGFCVIQAQFKVIKLDPANYYMDTVPIYWDWTVFAGLNIGMFVLIVAVLLIPTAMISKISPIKAIKFD